MALVHEFVFLFFSQLTLRLVAEPCSPSFDCGYLGKLRFPFTKTGYEQCGILTIHNCDSNSKPKQIQLQNNGKFFEVMNVNKDPDGTTTSMYIRDNDLYNLLESKNSEAFSHNYSLPFSFHFAHFHIKHNTTLLKCNKHMVHVELQKGISNYSGCSADDYDLYYGPSIGHSPMSSSTACIPINLPIKDFPDSRDPFTFLSANLLTVVQLSDECVNCHYLRRGQCQFNSEGKFYCANEKKRLSKARKVGIALGIILPSILIIGLLLLFFKRRRSFSREFQTRNTYADHSSNPDVEGGSVYFGIPLFSYKELEEATSRFDLNKQVGDGGFGTVYYGKLHDGREVAVKRLYEHNYRRVEQFMNEVQILTRLRHKNLVSLYGCTSRTSRELLLVYEYIPNGTVASHLHGESAKPGLLPWSTRMKIAVETASALAYLHATDIIHRDVKTNNILLDYSYCVKVADFGLSRLFPNDVTHVSTAPQGTPGYVDPEYYQCYQLTSKSDVYSFGVVLIELISSQPAVDMNRDKDEINLSNLAIKKIQEGSLVELVDPCLGFDSDNEVKRMVVSVAELAFQCLQQDKDLRPSMEKVLEMLERIESGKHEPEHLEVVDAGHGVSNVNSQQPQPSISPEWDQIVLLKNVKPPSSPITVTDSWESESTTPNVSA
ncbi:LEAF RUST 10 DISEASE-RESISTANCE LOCUS RECEPTOR-LIKE PROTEIN KINASE-like 1.1 isoform X3 [Arachis ipaensis]|uniref:LEAF RUST 10 DISEASE-RESISTANCE LOCUS RECEPTOR-LIKE PROTEIN KINASE-like 1.1 isoform X3 n=1 Tax=Arachis ipaensis TaxID=130454 RepID=UPI0007AF7431|nr:LEAF RUST 10 DISEASE-RESISTANCE LOCUS RECEPTOR-LIKE PROTEIN KINASE-like 1.1 isoform X3 [Arachis ipaensis]XP_020979948.1 LEAF RUST 10 DISEASE-RESISTANCE LOCUS RECEPTOR-LIKE PROTEIN KINASE-like 1.1 isoform X3 [Arachis ipaensis]XP_025655170.1 LEAF RUST 10 DISEASE-RESISTANCE LOCUS RECEPTOR-LIKE PROTEIN KINASE-like 1.1 isoform X3 [Arachis hypogaea]